MFKVASLSRKRKRSASESMTRDIRNIPRGHCNACGDCEIFTIENRGRVLCDYCGCPPAHHENLVKKARKSRTTSEADATDQSDLSEVSNFGILELADDDDESEAENESEVSEASSVSSSSSRNSSR